MEKSGKNRWGKRKRQNAIIEMIKDKGYFPDYKELAKKFRCGKSIIYKDIEEIKSKVKIDPKKIVIEVPRMLRKILRANFEDSFGVKKTLVLTNKTKEYFKQYTKEVDDVYAIQNARKMFEKNCETLITLMQALGMIEKVADKVEVSGKSITVNDVKRILFERNDREVGEARGTGKKKQDD